MSASPPAPPEGIFPPGAVHRRDSPFFDLKSRGKRAILDYNFAYRALGEGEAPPWWIFTATFCRGWTMGPPLWKTRWRWPAWRRTPASRTSSPRPTAISPGTARRITAPPPCARAFPGCGRPWSRRASLWASTRGPRCSAPRSCPSCWTAASFRPWAGAGICWWSSILTSRRSLWSSASTRSAPGA